MSAEQQTEIVANYILKNCPGSIRNEGAGETAVRLLDRYRSAINGIIGELAELQTGIPGPADNAFRIAAEALGRNP